MDRIFLSAAVLIVFGFGFWVMHKLDLFFSKNSRAAGGTPSLRIALSDPLLAESALAQLRAMAKQPDNTNIIFYSGSVEAMFIALEEGRIDLCLVDQNINTSSYPQTEFARILLSEGSVKAENIDISVQPLENRPVWQKAVWKTGNPAPLLHRFTDCLAEVKK